jgi:hypothetical protein
MLDFQDYDDEEDIDKFVQANVIVVNADRMASHWETQDLRELFDCDHGFMKGMKAPLIVRVPHARLRARESLVIDAVFQTLTALLVSSKMESYESGSMYSYNDRSAKMVLNSKNKHVCMNMLPTKLQNIVDAVAGAKSIKFVNREKESGLHFYKGFKMLTEVLLLRDDKPDWLEINARTYQPDLPIRQRLDQLTQRTIQQFKKMRKPATDGNKLFFMF